MEEPTQPAKKRKVEPAERKHSIDYTLEEAQTLIRARGVHSKVLDGAGATNAQRRAVWQAITDAVNAVSHIGGRELTSVQQRYKNIFKECKRYKSELRQPPTGGGPLSVKKPYFVVEMQRKLLMQQQSNAMFEGQALVQWSEGIGEWRENLRKYSALLDVQLHRARRNQTPDTEDLAALNLLSAELSASSIRVDDDDSVLADHNRRSSPF